MKTIELTRLGTYDELQDLANRVAGRDLSIVFSMFNEQDVVDDKDWHIIFPDIESKEPVLKGPVTLQINDWDGLQTADFTDPTWRDILIFTEENNDGHHIYLEAIYDRGDGVYEIILGS